MINYFDFYEIPLDLFPAMHAVKVKYYSYARKFHPDHNSALEESERMSAINNEAYVCLQDIECRIKHILELAGRFEEGSQSLPPDFLFEMMEFQEVIEEASNAESNETTLKRKQLANQIDEMYSKLDGELEELNKNLSLADMDLLEKLKVNLLKRRYFKRLKENLR